MSRHYMAQLSPYNTFNHLYKLYYNMLDQGIFFISHKFFLLRRRIQEEVFIYKFYQFDVLTNNNKCFTSIGLKF